MQSRVAVVAELSLRPLRRVGVLLVAFAMACTSAPSVALGQEMRVDFSGFEEGAELGSVFGGHGLLLASSGPAGPRVQLEPDLRPVLVPALGAPPIDSTVETISLFFVDPEDGTSPAVTEFVTVMTEVGPGNAAMLEAYAADGRLLGTAHSGPTDGPSTLRVAAGGIASARFVSTFDAESRGCIGAIDFAEPVPLPTR